MKLEKIQFWRKLDVIHHCGLAATKRMPPIHPFGLWCVWRCAVGDAHHTHTHTDTPHNCQSSKLQNHYEKVIYGIIAELRVFFLNSPSLPSVWLQNSEFSMRNISVWFRAHLVDGRRTVCQPRTWCSEHLSTLFFCCCCRNWCRHTSYSFLPAVTVT